MLDYSIRGPLAPFHITWVLWLDWLREGPLAQGNLSVAIIAEYIQLWDLLDEVQLQEEVDDTHKWRFDTSGQYSAKSAYDNLFLGATLVQPYERI
jgi:hypothetical protein